MGHFEGYFEGVKKVEAPSKYTEKWPIKQFAQKQKIISQIFKISGTLVSRESGEKKPGAPT
jgi:hypothetical protein